MEDYINVNPDVKRVVKTFQTAAERSLSGPNGNGLPQTSNVLSHISKMSAIDVEEYHKALAATKKQPDEKNGDYGSPFLAPPPFPIQQMPVFTPVDTTKSERSDTVLEEERIACFSVGGEKRLCLPQILNTVLRDFTLQQINAVCDELHIFCSRCNQVQLDTLKLLSILPSSAPSCGLITKTDAERLCNALLHSDPERSMEHPSRNSFKVYHECFGKCKGMFNPDVYTSPDAKCIRCMDCYGMFNPSKFVCHSHKSLENRTCHWGFDSANWRSYLLLAKDQNLSDNGRLKEALEEVKSRFDSSQKQKRRQSPERCPSTSESSTVAKRPKTVTDGGEQQLLTSSSALGGTNSWEGNSLRQLSAFHPWSPSLISAIKEGKLIPPPAIMRDGLAGILPSYLHTGPPVLLNPERVVPYSESSRYERHYTPNVSLAPTANQKGSPDEEYEEDLDDKGTSTSSTGPTGCVSSETSSSSRKASHASSKFDGELRGDTMEYDLPTDTDESSMASPTDSCKDIRVLDTPVYESTLEREVDMLRQALHGKIDNTHEAQTRFLQDFSKMRSKTEEAIQWLLRAHSALKRELETSRRHNLDLEEMITKMERDMRNMSLEKEYALKEVHERDSKSKRELEERLHNLESLYREVCSENHSLRRELAMVAEKVKPTSNGIEKLPPKSRLRMVLDSNSPPFDPSHPPTSRNEREPGEITSNVKRERDITVD